VKVFVSYQRADTLFAAHAVGYALRLAGHDAFVDTGSIGGGEVFPQVISTFISEANVVLALIGPAFDVARLHNPDSVVAFEWRRAQFHGCPVVPVLVDDGSMPSDSGLPPELRWLSKRNAYSLRRSSFSGDVSTLVEAIPALVGMPRRAARILWVDDRPANNERERQLLRPEGIVFDNVVSTSEAIEQLLNESYDLVITDLGREESSDRSYDAGAEFLQHPAVSVGGPPVIVYAGRWAVARRDELVRLGAAGVMANREQLIDTVLRTLGRKEDPAPYLTR
jgi:CheY-like chemotaxis protein